MSHLCRSPLYLSYKNDSRQRNNSYVDTNIINNATKLASFGIQIGTSTQLSFD